ncbi:MAG: 6,7-dimethyl-8-ribityllumazine synthase [Parcubacteria group bacterium]|jgi:6,7-dimethyl-8-ribityllumazine synthase
MRRDRKPVGKIIDGKKLKIGIIVSRFNDDITKKMLTGALSCLKENGVKDENIKTTWVPGSFEIPLACERMAASKKYDALVALGCIVKGETDHNYFIAAEVSRGIMDTMLEYSLPIGFGIITTNNLKQAQERSTVKNNKGREATEAVLMMIE